MKRKNEKIKYDVFSIRLHKGTKEQFIKGRIESGLSWNRYLLKLIKQNENKKNQS